MLKLINKHITEHKGFNIEALYKEMYQNNLKHYKNNEVVNNRLAYNRKVEMGEYTYFIRPEGVFVSGILNNLQDKEFNRLIKAGDEIGFQEFMSRVYKVEKKGSKYYFRDKKSGKVREILK